MMLTTIFEKKLHKSTGLLQCNISQGKPDNLLITKGIKNVTNNDLENFNIKKTKIPIEKDIERTIIEIIEYHGEMKLIETILSSLSSIIPKTVLSLSELLYSLYNAVVLKKRIDIALINSLTYAGCYLLTNNNIISELILTVKSSIDNNLDNEQIKTLLEQGENIVPEHFYAGLCSLSILLASVLPKTEPPQRWYLKIPILISNFLNRINLYLYKLNEMTQNIKTVHNERNTNDINRNEWVPTIEVNTDSEVRLTNFDQYFDTAENLSYKEDLITSYNSTITINPDRTIRATVKNKPGLWSAKNNNVSIADENAIRILIERMHHYSIDMAKEMGRFSELLYCDTKIKERELSQNINEIYKHYQINSKCDATSSLSIYKEYQLSGSKGSAIAVNNSNEKIQRSHLIDNKECINDNNDGGCRLLIRSHPFDGVANGMSSGASSLSGILPALMSLTSMFSFGRGATVNSPLNLSNIDQSVLQFTGDINRIKIFIIQSDLISLVSVNKTVFKEEILKWKGNSPFMPEFFGILKDELSKTEDSEYIELYHLGNNIKLALYYETLGDKNSKKVQFFQTAFKDWLSLLCQIFGPSYCEHQKLKRNHVKRDAWLADDKSIQSDQVLLDGQFNYTEYEKNFFSHLETLGNHIDYMQQNPAWDVDSYMTKWLEDKKKLYNLSSLKTLTLNTTLTAVTLPKTLNQKIDFKLKDLISGSVILQDNQRVKVQSRFGNKSKQVLSLLNYISKESDVFVDFKKESEKFYKNGLYKEAVKNVSKHHMEVSIFNFLIEVPKINTLNIEKNNFIELVREFLAGRKDAQLLNVISHNDKIADLIYIPSSREHEYGLLISTRGDHKYYIIDNPPLITWETKQSGKALDNGCSLYSKNRHLKNKQVRELDPEFQQFIISYLPIRRIEELNLGNYEFRDSYFCKSGHAYSFNFTKPMMIAELLDELAIRHEDKLTQDFDTLTRSRAEREVDRKLALFKSYSWVFYLFLGAAEVLTGGTITPLTITAGAIWNIIPAEIKINNADHYSEVIEAQHEIYFGLLSEMVFRGVAELPVGSILKGSYKQVSKFFRGYKGLLHHINKSREVVKNIEKFIGHIPATQVIEKNIWNKEAQNLVKVITQQNFGKSLEQSVEIANYLNAHNIAAKSGYLIKYNNFFESPEISPIFLIKGGNANFILNMNDQQNEIVQEVNYWITNQRQGECVKKIIFKGSENIDTHLASHIQSSTVLDTLEGANILHISPEFKRRYNIMFGKHFEEIYNQVIDSSDLLNFPAVQKAFPTKYNIDTGTVLRNTVRKDIIKNNHGYKGMCVDYAFQLQEEAGLITKNQREDLVSLASKFFSKGREIEIQIDEYSKLFADGHFEHIHDSNKLIQIKNEQILLFVNTDDNSLSHMVVSIGNGRFAGIKNDILDPSLVGKEILTAEQFGQFNPDGYLLPVDVSGRTYKLLAGYPKGYLNELQLLTSRSVENYVKKIADQDPLNLVLRYIEMMDGRLTNHADLNIMIRSPYKKYVNMNDIVECTTGKLSIKDINDLKGEDIFGNNERKTLRITEFSSGNENYLITTKNNNFIDIETNEVYSLQKIKQKIKAIKNRVEWVTPKDINKAFIINKYYRESLLDILVESKALSKEQGNAILIQIEKMYKQNIVDEMSLYNTFLKIDSTQLTQSSLELIDSKQFGRFLIIKKNNRLENVLLIVEVSNTKKTCFLGLLEKTGYEEEIKKHFLVDVNKYLNQFNQDEAKISIFLADLDLIKTRQLSLLGEDSKFYLSPYDKKQLNVLVHGETANLNYIDGIEFSNVILGLAKKNNIDMETIDSIHLQSCYGLRGGKYSSAQIIANKLDKKVIAYRNEVTTDFDKQRADKVFIQPQHNLPIMDLKNQEIRHMKEHDFWFGRWAGRDRLKELYNNIAYINWKIKNSFIRSRRSNSNFDTIHQLAHSDSHEQFNAILLTIGLFVNNHLSPEQFKQAIDNVYNEELIDLQKLSAMQEKLDDIISHYNMTDPVAIFKLKFIYIFYDIPQLQNKLNEYIDSTSDNDLIIKYSLKDKMEIDLIMRDINIKLPVAKGNKRGYLDTVLDDINPEGFVTLIKLDDRWKEVMPASLSVQDVFNLIISLPYLPDKLPEIESNDVKKRMLSKIVRDGKVCYFITNILLRSKKQMEINENLLSFPLSEKSITRLLYAMAFDIVSSKDTVIDDFNSQWLDAFLFYSHNIDRKRSLVSSYIYNKYHQDNPILISKHKYLNVGSIYSENNIEDNKVVNVSFIKNRGKNILTIFSQNIWFRKGGQYLWPFILANFFNQRRNDVITSGVIGKEDDPGQEKISLLPQYSHYANQLFINKENFPAGSMILIKPVSNNNKVNTTFNEIDENMNSILLNKIANIKGEKFFIQIRNPDRVEQAWFYLEHKNRKFISDDINSADEDKNERLHHVANFINNSDIFIKIGKRLDNGTIVADKDISKNRIFLNEDSRNFNAGCFRINEIT